VKLINKLENSKKRIQLKIDLPPIEMIQK